MLTRPGPIFCCDPTIGGYRLDIKSQDIVVSDSEESGITHTTVSSLYEDLSDIGSPRADDHELLEPPYMLEDPYEDDDETLRRIPLTILLTEEMTELIMDIEEDEDVIWTSMRTTVPSAEETEPFETDESAATPPPHPAYHSVTITPPHRLTAPPPSPIRSLGYRAATIRMRAEAAATSHSLPLPPPFILSPTRPDAPPPLPTSAPTSFPPLSLPTDSHREGRPEVNLPPRMIRQVRRDPERYVGYGITDSWDEIVETLQGAPVSTDTELGAHMREFESLVRRDTDEILHEVWMMSMVKTVSWPCRDKMIFGIDLLMRKHDSLMEIDAGMSQRACATAMDSSDLDSWRGYFSTTTTVALRRWQRSQESREEDVEKGDGSTTGTGRHTAGAGDRLTRTGDDIAGTGYYLTGTAGTSWSLAQPREAAIGCW
ncbi:hypothetical protein Tco_1446634 [Tanacetum coccineum]